MRSWWLFVVMGLAFVGYLGWVQLQVVSVEECVRDAIIQMQKAQKPKQAVLLHKVLVAAQANVVPAERAAAAAFLGCGIAALPVLRHQLRIGNRSRRVAMQTLLLQAGREKSWRPAVQKSMWGLLGHEDWRVREVAFLVLWQRETRSAKKAALWTRVTADTHHFLRYLAVAFAHQETPPSLSVQRMVSLLRQGAAPREGGHAHGKGLGHKHDHKSHVPPGLQRRGGVEKWLRERKLCRIDSDYDWPARRLLVRAMTTWKVPLHQKIHWWLDALRDRKPAVSAAARAQIIAQGKVAIPSLKLVLERASTPRKHKVAALLAAIGDDAIPTLMKLLQAQDAGIWHAAAKGLQAAGSRSRGHKTRKVLVGALCQQLRLDPKRRRAAAEILARLGSAATRCLLGGVQLGAAAVRRASCRGIGLQARRFCRNPSPGPGCQKLALQALAALRSSWDDPLPSVQAEALWATGRLRRAASPSLSALRVGIRALPRRSSQVQEAWLMALVRIGGHRPAIRAALRKWMTTSAASMQSKVTLLRGLAREAHLNQMPGEALLPWLAGLRSPTRQLRAATRALLLAYPQHHGVLLGQLHKGRWLFDPNPQIRVAVALALARWTQWPKDASLPVAQRLVALCLRDGSRQVQQASAQALLQLGKKAQGLVLPAHWRALLAHKQWPIRMNAARALATMGNAASFALDGLIVALRDKRRQVRRAAAIALGKIGKAAAPAQGPLRHAMGDRAIDVQHAAKRALADVISASRRRP